MANEDTPKIFHMVMVTGRDRQERLLYALSEKGCHVVNIIYGKDTGRLGFIVDNIWHDDNKVMVVCLVSATEADAIFSMLLDDFNFDRKDTGIAFTIPVEKVSY